MGSKASLRSGLLRKDRRIFLLKNRLTLAPSRSESLSAKTLAPYGINQKPTQLCRSRASAEKSALLAPSGCARLPSPGSSLTSFDKKPLIRYVDAPTSFSFLTDKTAADKGIEFALDGLFAAVLHYLGYVFYGNSFLFKNYFQNG